MEILNRRELESTPLRRDALDIVQAGVKAVNAGAAIRQNVLYDGAGNSMRVKKRWTYRLAGSRVFVTGAGKASGVMARALEKTLPDSVITCGVVNAKFVPQVPGKIKVNAAGHPLPDEIGVQGTREMLGIAQSCRLTLEDLVICLISGGGSALMSLPAEGINLSDKQAVTRILIKSGASIREINTVRKHISGVKGGRFANAFQPARVVSLIVSDVIGNDLSVIASGITTADPTTFADALKVLTRYDLMSRVPPSVASHLMSGAAGLVAETPKKVVNATSHIIADNRTALEAMEIAAATLGYQPLVITSAIKGDVNQAAQKIAGEIISGRYSGYTALILGGETTVRVNPGDGRGGRNQHYALATMQALKRYSGQWLVASIATDGSDFIPEIGGAVVDNLSVETTVSAGLEPGSFLARNDSYTFFEKLGSSLVYSGDTSTNVADVVLYLLG